MTIRLPFHLRVDKACQTWLPPSVIAAAVIVIVLDHAFGPLLP